MRVTYDMISMAGLNALSRSFSDLNETTNDLLSAVGVDRAASAVRSMPLADLVASDVAAANAGITSANTQISMNQTADAALETIHGKLQTMRTLAQEVALGDLTPEEIDANDAEYQTLADEIEALLEDTTYNGRQLISGRDPLVRFNLEHVLDISLADLPDGAVEDISIAVTDVSMARAQLTADSKALEYGIQDLQDQVLELTAFDGRVETAEAALTVMASVTDQFMDMISTAFAAQANTSSTTMVTLVDAVFGRD